MLEEGRELALRNCSGLVMPGTDLRLVDAEGNDVPQGEVGEIWTRGPAITPGYWNRPREDYFTGDWFRTGDCGRKDEAGRLYIVDRLREVYRSGGENIYPAEVELVAGRCAGREGGRGDRGARRSLGRGRHGDRRAACRARR